MNENENQMQGNDGGTATPNAQVESANLNENQNQQPNGEAQTANKSADAEPKTFTQEQVNEIVRERLSRSENKFLTKYGVKTKQELDDLVGRAKSYDVLKDRYSDLQVENSNLNKELTYRNNDINPERYEDIEAYFKGKGIDLTNDNLINELAKHPEWVNAPKEDYKTTINVLGNEPVGKAPRMSEKERAAKIFGLNKLI